MKQLATFTFTPENDQPAADKGPPVTFTLKPLDMRQFVDFQGAFNRNGRLTSDSYAIAIANIVGWENAPIPYAPGALQKVLNGEPNVTWALWLSEIAGALYARALMTEDERKN